MPAPLKLIQISDLHLHATATARVHGWDVEQAWQRVAHDAMQRHADADLWLLSGDLIDDESIAGYQRLDAWLGQLPCPVLALAGNHDDPQAMQLHLRNAAVHAAIRVGGWRIHALDSHIDGVAAGRIGMPQLQALRTALTRNKQPTVVCVHHPPVTTGSRWLDAIGLQDDDALRDIIRSHDHIAAVLCGHAHQALATRIGQAWCWITPSTMRQFLPQADSFAIDATARPGYRIVMLHADGHASSQVQRVDNNCA